MLAAHLTAAGSRLVGTLGGKLGTEDRRAAGKGHGEGRDAGAVRGGAGRRLGTGACGRVCAERAVGEVFPPSARWGLPSQPGDADGSAALKRASGEGQLQALKLQTR